ncbi:MAG: sigma-54-dependent Fis family transcriptional regulator, partial [Myxococcales bacterium]|nr:sigma-54-dependent Fis family transcriptional regulator [Myxococcales bacterium]
MRVECVDQAGEELELGVPALEERAIRRVGEAVERPVDTRIVAATHRDLKAVVDNGSFREDLWYRLNVATIRVPPPRDRREDIEL